VAQFFYVAAQAGIFSFFINYVTEETPAVSASAASGWNSFAAGAPGFLGDWFAGWLKTGSDGGFAFTDKAASNLASLGFFLFLLGRLSGAWILKNNAAHRVLGLYGVLSVAMCLLVFLKLGWLSMLALFLSYFFMSIMFPTIFALGIHGLGEQAKKAAPFIVMAIMGGMFLPKLMGHVADEWDMSRGFIVPSACLVIVAVYGFAWNRLSKLGGIVVPSPTTGH
jgi:FHS family L-fucose permease-like MFS transporter